MNQKTDEQRTTDDKIARLRKRVKTMQLMAHRENDVAFLSVLLGILDLLDDEL